jgi:hypothetical protein
MSFEFNDEVAPPNLRIGRIFLVNQLQSLFSENIDDMALHVTEGLEVVQVLSGVVLPQEQEGTTSYSHLMVYVVGLATNTRKIAEVSFSDSSVVHEYDLVVTPTDLEKLELEKDAKDIAWRDSHTSHKLGRAVFSRKQAEGIMNVMRIPDESQIQRRLDKWQQ